MKIVKQEIGPAKKPRIWFALGHEDIILLSGLLEQAMYVFPTSTPELKETKQRLRAMHKGVMAYLRGDKIDGPKKQPKEHDCPYCDRKLRSKKGVAEHISRVHQETMGEGHKHEYVYPAIGGFPGHEHIHPTGPARCKHCGKIKPEEDQVPSVWASHRQRTKPIVERENM